MNNLKIRTILFDMDGTLVDSRADLTDAVNHVLKEMGYPLQTIDEVVPRIGNGLRRLLKDSIGMSDPEHLLQAKDLFENFYSEHCTDKTDFYPDVKTDLKSLAQRVKMGVVTNKPELYADKILKHLGVRELFGAVIGGDTTAQAKPDPLPVLEAMKQLQAEPSSTLLIGDGHQDIRAGKAAKTLTCVVRYGFGFHPDLMQLNPDMAVNEFNEIKEIVK